MAVDEQEYVIAPWERDQGETDIRTIELPSREIVVQLEVPEHIMDSIERLADEYEIPVNRALAERLEINRARVEVLSATSLDDTEEVRDHLAEAREYLAGVDALDTTGIESDIERTWQDQLESA